MPQFRVNYLLGGSALQQSVQLAGESALEAAPGSVARSRYGRCGGWFPCGLESSETSVQLAALELEAFVHIRQFSFRYRCPSWLG